MHPEGTEFKVPRLNPNDHHVELLNWRVNEGEFVAQGAVIAEVESSKATVTLQSSAAGYIRQHFRAGQSVPVGSTLASFHADQASSIVKAPSPSSAESAHPAVLKPNLIGLTLLSPKAKAYIQAERLDAGQFQGLGLVTVRIIEQMLGKRALPHTGTKATSLAPPPPAEPKAPEGPVPGYRSERINATKKREINALTAGQSGLINSSLTIQFMAEPIRKTLSQHNLLNGQMLPLILFEFAQLLRDYPQFLSFYEHGYLHYHDRIHIGVAIDFGEELKVPVLFDAEQKTASEIAAEVVANGIKYLNHEFLPEDLIGSTVTVTDLSAHDVLMFQPLLNERQAIILGIGGDKQAPGQPMTLTLVFDHRILSGRIVGESLKKLRHRLTRYGIAAADLSPLSADGDANA